jgi:glutamine amidotransferase
MCRLFAQHADPLFDHCQPLCIAHNALRMQSHKHPHGWGIGWYDRGVVRIRRGVMAAHADEAFVEAAQEACSDIVVAHVRDASVGPVTAENTHPFVHRRWLFAHNGTVARFKKVARVRAALEAEIAPALRRFIRGDTDSERCFYLFLTRLSARPGRGPPDLESVRAALAETVSTVVRIADRGADPKSSLNFVVSDGRVLAACRRHRPLRAAPYMTTRGLFQVASEPIGSGPWIEIPEDGFIGIDREHRVLASPLRTRRRRAVAA